MGLPAMTDAAGRQYELAIETGAIFGDFYLQGGSVDVFAPGIGFDEDGAVFDAFVDGRNLFTDPFAYPYLAGAVASEGDAAEFLQILLQMPRDYARQTFRQVCASN